MRRLRDCRVWGRGAAPPRSRARHSQCRRSRSGRQRALAGAQPSNRRLRKSGATRKSVPHWNDSSTLGVAAAEGRHALGFVPKHKLRGARRSLPLHAAPCLLTCGVASAGALAARADSANRGTATTLGFAQRGVSDRTRFWRKGRRARRVGRDSLSFRHGHHERRAVASSEHEWMAIDAARFASTRQWARIA